MSKHPQHPHGTHSHHAGKKGRHHHLTRAEIAAAQEAARAAQAKAHQVKTVAMRQINSAGIEDELSAWQHDLLTLPPTAEQPISPLAVPMLVRAQFDSPRKTADGKPYMHGAIDMVPAQPTREPVAVVAALSGRVLFVGNWDLDSGYSVLVGGRDGRIYSYAHLKKGTADVQVGQQVVQGDPLGIMGTSGNAREMACLHYKLREPIEGLGLTRMANLLSATPIDYSENASLANYKPVWPSIDGAELRNGMVIQPGKRMTMTSPPPLQVQIDPWTVDTMRSIASIDPLLSTTEITPPLVTPVIDPTFPAMPRFRR